MKKWICSTALMLALGAGAASVLSLSTDLTAQEKAKEAKKATAAAKEAKGFIKISEGKDGKFRFSIYEDIEGDEKDKYIVGSVAYATKEEAAKGVEKIKSILKDAKIEYVKKDEKEEKKEKAKDKDKN
ncbi:MAG: hypothetical protein ACRC8S_11055 [Fimbriiglobus sp.]